MSLQYPVLAEYAKEHTILTIQIKILSVTLERVPSSSTNHAHMTFMLRFLKDRINELDGYIKDICKCVLKEEPNV